MLVSGPWAALTAPTGRVGEEGGTVLLNVKAAALVAVLVAPGATLGAVEAATWHDADHPGAFRSPIKVHGVCAGGPARYLLELRSEARTARMTLTLTHAGRHVRWNVNVRSESETSNSGSSGVSEGSIVTHRGTATIRGAARLGNSESFAVYLHRAHGRQHCFVSMKA
jgi:hypothetical protein